MVRLLVFAAATCNAIIPGRLHTWTHGDDNTLPAQIFVPMSRSADDEHGRSPVILFLHGGGDGPFDVMNQQSLPSLLLTNASFSSMFPFIVVTPCSTCGSRSQGWTTANFAKVAALLERVVDSEHVRGDPTRIALTGQSMGGAGLWRYAGRAGIWSALVPVCAAIRPSQQLADAACCAIEGTSNKY